MMIAPPQRATRASKSSALLLCLVAVLFCLQPAQAQFYSRGTDGTSTNRFTDLSITGSAVNSSTFTNINGKLWWLLDLAGGSPGGAGGVTNSLLVGSSILTNDHFELASGNTNLLQLVLDTNGGRARVTFTGTSQILTNNDARLGDLAYSNSAVFAAQFAGSTHTHTLAGDATGDIGSTTVGKLHGRTINSGAPSVGDVLYWDGSQWKGTNISLVAPAAAVTNLSTVLEGWSSFPDISSDAYPAGSNGREGVAMPSTNSAVVWVLTAPQRWTGTNWTMRGAMRFPQAGSIVCTVDVQVASFASGSTADPIWTSYPTQQLIFASSGDASNRVIGSFAPSTLWTNVQPGQRVYVRSKRACTNALLPWLINLEVNNQ